MSSIPQLLFPWGFQNVEDESSPWDQRPDSDASWYQMPNRELLQRWCRRWLIWYRRQVLSRLELCLQLQTHEQRTMKQKQSLVWLDVSSLMESHRQVELYEQLVRILRHPVNFVVTFASCVNVHESIHEPPICNVDFLNCMVFHLWDGNL